MAGQKRSGGTVFTGPDGKLYFVRDEILPALKLEGEALQRTKKELGDKISAGLSSTSYLKEDILDRVPPSFTVHQGKMAAAAVTSVRRSTIMCPWFC
jgi:hypothetical protein